MSAANRCHSQKNLSVLRQSLNYATGKDNMKIGNISSLDFVKKEEGEFHFKKQDAKGFKEAVRQINLVKQGKLKARDARELLREL